MKFWEFCRWFYPKKSHNYLLVTQFSIAHNQKRFSLYPSSAVVYWRSADPFISPCRVVSFSSNARLWILYLSPKPRDSPDSRVTHGVILFSICFLFVLIYPISTASPSFAFFVGIFLLNLPVCCCAPFRPVLEVSILPMKARNQFSVNTVNMSSRSWFTGSWHSKH